MMMHDTSPTPSPALPTGTTDAQLNTDTQSVDQNMSAADGDVNSIDQSLNDQQTNLQ